MPTHVALLRGINVGGRNRVAMADLREVVASLGHTDVATVIQSGNVAFTAAATADPGALATELEAAIAERLGVAPRVVVLSCAQLARTAADDPFPADEDPRRVHVVFLGEEPGPEVAERVAEAQRESAAAGSRDEARLIGRALFLHTPDGFGRSDLAARLAAGGRTAPTEAATGRNRATVRRLLALCDG